MVFLGDGQIKLSRAKREIRAGHGLILQPPLSIAPPLSQHVENLAFVVDGTPQYIRAPATHPTISR
jgi:hypothetical protein